MAKKQQRNRRMVSIPDRTFAQLERIHQEIETKAGRPITFGGVIERALECLADAHSRGAWLSPKEAAPVLEQRHRDQVVSVVAQLLARFAPERRLQGIAFDTEHDTLVVNMADADPFPLIMSGPLLGPDRVTDSTH